MLRSLPSDSRWCGPAAVSILTGKPYSEVLGLISRISDKPAEDVKGVWPEETLLALTELGYTARPIHVSRLMTLRTFMANRSMMERATPMLIEVWGHFLTAHLDWACDNWTKKPVPFSEFPKPNRKVIRAWSIT